LRSGEFIAKDNPAMNKHPIQRGPGLIASLYDGPLGLNPAITLHAFMSHFNFFLDIEMVVETSSAPFAGTDAEIKIKIFGTDGNVPERKISGSFERGR